MALPARTLPVSNSNDPVQAIRRFNRFYTRQIGVLQEHLLESQLSLTEVRVLYELAHRERLTAIDLRRELGLDRGYLSRMLQAFAKHGWIKTTPSRADRRRIFLSLTSKGRKVFAPLDRRSSEQVAEMLARLSESQQGSLLSAMTEIENLLAPQEQQVPRGLKSTRNDNEGQPTRPGVKAVPFQDAHAAEKTGKGASSTRADKGHPLHAALAAEESLPEANPPSTPNAFYTLRPHRPGDMGWVVQRHGELYWQEYRYDERFEALVAGIVAEFIQNFDPKCERCWIAEKDGERMGTIFLVKKLQTVAKLRLLLVEPGARGLGIGKRLVSECVDFARQAGYKRILLWTQSELHAARHLYQQAGFKRIAQKPHQSWGRTDLVAETWELNL